MITISTDEERASQSLVLSLLIGTSLAVFIFVLFASLLISNWKLVAVLLAGSAMLIAPLALLRRGHLHASSLVVVLVIIGTITSIATVGQGIRDLAIIAFPIVLVFAGLTLNRTLFRLSAGLMLAAICWLVFGETYGWYITRPFSYGESSNWWVYLITVIIILMMSALAVDLLATGIRRSMDKARQEISQRTQAEAALRQSKDSLGQILDSLDGIVYVADMDTYEVLFVNAFGKKLIGDATGKTCWQSLQSGQEGPCAFCTNERLLHPDGTPTGVHVWEFQNTITGKWYECRDMAIVWPDKRMVRMEVAVDVTDRKQADSLLRESEDKYRVLIETADEGIIVSQDARLKYVNPKVSEMTGFAKDELISLPFIDFVHQDDRDLIRGNYQKRLNGEDVDNGYSIRIATKDLGQKWVELSAVKIEWEGQPATLSFITDITERKRVEDALLESNDQMEIAQAMGHTGSWVYNLKTDRIWGTVEAHRIFGFPLVAGDFLLEAIEACIPERGRVHQALVALISDEREYDIEYRIIPADGSPPREIHSIAKLEKDEQGSPWKVLGFIQDITQVKRAQEDRIAREIAEQSNRAKSEFISRMSHELRTPLNAILGFAQLLKMDELEPNQERGVDQINKSGRHLLNLVNEVLDLARVESGKLHVSLEPLRLEEALHDTIELIRPLAEARGISLSLGIAISPEVWVRADHKSLKQVLLNILSNAVKYNREGGEIAVTSSITLDGSLRLQVRDMGEGIAPDKMDRLFMPFDRLDRDSIAQDGTGLGLVLSKGLMEAMGGRIGAESTPGEGSTFWLELKMVEA